MARASAAEASLTCLRRAVRSYMAALASLGYSVLDDDDDNDGNDQDGDDDSEYTYGSESDDGNKVKSFSDKRIDNVMAHISKINNALKINDFSAL